MQTILRILATLLGAALVVVVWYEASGVIVQLLDFNLQLIKWGCALLPAPYGSMAESALRAGLGADKALLFWEGSAVFAGLFRLLFGGEKKAEVKVLSKQR